MKEIKKFFEKLRRDQVFLRASSLAFTSVIALVPMLAFGYFLLSAFGALDRLQGQLENFVAANLAPSFADQVMIYFNSIRGKISPEALGLFGVLGFLITSLQMLHKMEMAFNAICGAKHSRPLSRQLANYWTLITLGPLLMAASVLLFGQAVSWLRQDSGDISKALVVLFTLVPYATTCIFFTGLFYLLPNSDVNKRNCFIAGAVTGIVFELSKQAYALYASAALQNSVYGSLAILPVFLVWLNLIWIITLLGFEFCCHLGVQKQRVVPDAK